MKTRLLVLALIFILQGCAPLKQYHVYDAGAPVLSNRCFDETSRVGAACAAGTPSSPALFKYAFVEFDEFGNLYQPGAVDKLIGEIRAQPDKFLLITYVHGWKHSAQETDKDVQEFYGAMRNLAKADAASGRQVIGLYFGWRGGVLPVPVVENLTFWDRKSTAHAVGSGAVTEVITRLDAVKNRSNNDDRQATSSQQSRMVVFGHSFGGAVLFTALAPIFEARFTSDREYEANCQSEAADTGDGIAPRGIGDLVVLINPAFEAMQFSTLHKMSLKCRYAQRQAPLLAVITGENDWATGLAFPIARAFRSVFSAYSSDPDLKDENFWANSKTIGHYAPYRTHTIGYAADNTADTQSASWNACGDYMAPYREALPMMPALPAQPADADSVARTIVGRDAKGTAFTMTMTPNGDYPENNPILNIFAPPPIIDGHGGIYSCQLMTLINALVTNQAPQIFKGTRRQAASQ